MHLNPGSFKFSVFLPTLYNAIGLSKFIQDGRVNALYSTPSIYTDVKNAANLSWPLKTDDYFP